MAVTGIGERNAYQVQQEQLQKAGKSAEHGAEKSAEAVQEKKDAFVRSTESESVTYSPESLKNRKLSADELKAMEEERLSAFRTMLENMLTRQGEEANLHMFGLDFTVTPEDSAKAAEEISEEGDWGVEAVADRIMNMAKALSGGDASKFDMLREAVEEGFAQAQKVWGEEEMPEITKATHEEVSKRFDEWAEELGIAKEEAEEGGEE